MIGDLRIFVPLTLLLGLTLPLSLPVTEPPDTEEASGSNQNKEFYVISEKPPSVSVIDSETLEIVASISLDFEPGTPLIEPNGRFLYVGRAVRWWKDDAPPSELAVVDLELRKQVKKIPLGRNAPWPALSDDGRYVVAYGRGKVDEDGVVQEPGRITLVDTRTNDVAATFSIPAENAGAVFLATLMGRAPLVGKPDASRIFAPAWEGSVEVGSAAPAESTLTVIETTRDTRPEVLRFNGFLTRTKLSRDKQWLYAVALSPRVFRRRVGEIARTLWPFGGGKNKGRTLAETGPAALHAIDVESGRQLKSHDLGGPQASVLGEAGAGGVLVLSHGPEDDDEATLYEFQGPEMVRRALMSAKPVFVKRSQSRPGILVGTCDGISYWSDGASELSEPIALDEPREAPQADSRPADHEVCPSAMIELPGQDRVAVAFDKNKGRPSPKLAIVDLREDVTVGIASAKRRFSTGEKVAIGALSPLIIGLAILGGPVLHERSPRPAFSEDDLEASLDGKFIYVLNKAASVILVLSSEDGSTVNQIRLGKDPRSMGLGPGGRLVWVEDGRGLTLIDTETNETQARHKLGGNVLSVEMDAANHRILVLTAKSLDVLDAENGERLSRIRGFKRAGSVVLPWAEPSGLDDENGGLK